VKFEPHRAAARASKRAILVGDLIQLPPIVREYSARNEGAGSIRFAGPSASSLPLRVWGQCPERALTFFLVHSALDMIRSDGAGSH
jgi:hypothetical protein